MSVMDLLNVKNTFLDCESPWKEAVELRPRPSSDPTSSISGTNTDATDKSSVHGSAHGSAHDYDVDYTVREHCLEGSAIRSATERRRAAARMHLRRMCSDDAAAGLADATLRGEKDEEKEDDEDSDFVSRTKSQRRRQQKKDAKALARLAADGLASPSSTGPAFGHGAAAGGGLKMSL